MRITSARIGPLLSEKPNFQSQHATEESGVLRVAPESLYQVVSRMRARWLKRVMYDSRATSSEKCLAYAVFDHLNCVTLDSWPSQRRLAALLGFISVKTIQRAATGLEDKALLVVNRSRRRSYRYAPRFWPSDGDNTVVGAGQTWFIEKDKIVSESLLPIHLTPPTPTAADVEKSDFQNNDRRKQRGADEFAIAEMLGRDGMELLARLSELDDDHVQRLCDAFAIGAVGDRELAAARLAAEQAR